MKSDHQQPGNSSYSTFVSIETGDTNASMLTTTCQQSNHEAMTQHMLIGVNLISV